MLHFGFESATDNTETVLIKLVNSSSVYLRELAALSAQFTPVRLRAIQLLEKPSKTVLQQIMENESNTEFAQAAKRRIDQLNDDIGLFGKLFKSS